MRRILLAICLASFLSVPLASSALTQQEKNALILQLVQKVLELQQKIVALGGAPIAIPPGLAALAQGSGSAGGAAVCNITTTLARGARGAEVMCLQQFLITEGLLAADSATGYFGPLTRAAVIALQRQHGLEQVGHVGRLTRAVIAARTPSGTSTPAAPVSVPPSTGGGGGGSTPPAVSAPPPSSGGGGGGGGDGVTEIWMGPSLYTPDTYPIMVAPESKWIKTLGTIKVFAMYWPFFDRAPKTYLGPLAQTLKKHGVRFDVNTGGIRESLCASGPLDTLGERSAAEDMKSFTKWLDAGGVIGEISLDGPERRVLYTAPCSSMSPTIDIAARETVDYMKTMTQLLAARGHARPNFNLIVNFPNWDYAGMPKTFVGVNPLYTADYKDVFKTLHDATVVTGIPIGALVVDNPGQPLGERVRLLDMQAHSYGIKVAPYINTYNQTMHAPNEICTALVTDCRNNVSRDWRPPDDLREQTWLAVSLDYLDQWIQATGRKPDIVYVGTWMVHPRNVIPETTFGTLSYDALIIKDVLAGNAVPIFKDQSKPVGAMATLSASTTAISGWAYDPDEPGTSVYVHIYRGSTFVASIAANQPRADVNATLGITGDHGFAWTIPAAYATSSNVWHVYAVNYQNMVATARGSLQEIANSPQTYPNAPALPAPSVSVLQGVHVVPVVFNDWTQKPVMNAEVTPAFFTVGSGWTAFFIPTSQMYMCATPDNIFTLSGFPGINSRQNCHLRMQSYMADTNYTATDDPYPWRWKYHTAFSGFVLGTSGTYTLYSINHGEHGNVGANLFPGQKTCLQAPDIGYGVIDCNNAAQQWASYNAFISMSSMPFTLATLGSDTRFTDLGPIAWPANGYVETINGTVVKATDGGIRHSSSIVKDGYLYVFFDDQSQGDSAAGRGPGFKVMRAPIVANSIDPHSFKTYYNGAFTDSALPAGFTAANAKDFYAQKGGRSSAIFPDLPVRLLPWTAGVKRTDKRTTTRVHMFDVARVQGTNWYLGVSLDQERGIILRLSKDLAHWSAPTLVPGTEWDYWAAKGDSEHYMLLYPRLANANGKTTSSIDPNDFYIIGMTIKDPDDGGPLPNQKTMQAVELKLVLP